MPAISALVHTRNEAAVVGPCLESLRWVDELVVADMASTDATRELAAAAGARVIDVPVVPLVDTVRNLAVAQCAGPWVLVVDADERVPATLAARLREIVADEPNAADAYALPRQNRFLGVWLEHGFWPDPQVRFFRKEAARWTDHVHEPPRVTGRLEALPAEPAFALDHPGYARDLGRFVEKLSRYAPLDARRLRETENPAVFPWLLRRPLSEFSNRYFRDGAWRHGAHGLVWSGLQGVYQFLVAAHLWALREVENAADVPGAEGLRRGTRREGLRAAARLLRPLRGNDEGSPKSEVPHSSFGHSFVIRHSSFPMPPPPLHLITPEYPPQIGGVSDYTRAMAVRLAESGREVHVWAPGNDPAETSGPAGVSVHRVAGTWTRADRARVDAALDRFPGPRRLLVHWVPHGYEPRGLARGFTRWLRERRRRAGDRVELIIHEPGVAFERNWRQWVLAVLHREMLLTLLGTAERVWLSTPAWEPRLFPWLTLANLGGTRPSVRWLPLLLDVPVVNDPPAVAAARSEFAGDRDGELLGHFGTYGEGVARLLGPALAEILVERPTVRALLLGRGGERYLKGFCAQHPALAGRVRATGETDGSRLSVLVQACDLLLQPYPDGITTRRTSALAVLAHGRAMVTTTGHLTERALWEAAGACRVVGPAGLTGAVGELLTNADARAALGERGRAWYEREFVGCDYGALFAEP